LVANLVSAEEKKAVSETGLVAYWSFDEGKGNDGIIEGDVNWVKGFALEFNGEEGYVDCGDNSSLDMPTNDFTVEVWVKSNGWTKSSIISKGSWFNQGKGYDISYPENPKNIYFNIYDGSKYYPLKTTLGETFPWSHIVGVRRGGTVEVWVNGAKEQSIDYPTTSISNSENLYIGRGLNGFIDEVKIYNHALTAEEIKTNYLKSIPAP